MGEPWGRQDWDWVSFSDYEADTAKLADEAANIIKAKNEEIADIKETLARVVSAAGGVVRLYDGDLFRPPPSLHKSYDVAGMCTVLSAPLKHKETEDE